jgi:hypothetical protein
VSGQWSVISGQLQESGTWPYYSELLALIDQLLTTDHCQLITELDAVGQAGLTVAVLRRESGDGHVL